MGVTVYFRDMRGHCLGPGGASCALAAALLLGTLGCDGPAERDTRPNLVVVLSDDHRWDALGAAGNPAVVTPVMDDLARNGVYFRQAITSVSQCHPVRASLLTGLPAHRHGVYSNQHQAPGIAETLCRRPTVASLLREAGYRTVLVGKWHLPPPPWECGFDEARTWLPEGGTHYRDPELVSGSSHESASVAGFTQEIFTGEAVDFLRSEAARSGPFLLWLGYTAPHFPYEPNPERIEALYAGKSDEQLLPPGFPRGVPANDWRHYDEAVSYLDEQVGTLLATLEETGLAQQTVVVLLGDNGYMMGERGVGGPGSRSNGKQVPYESSLRVPFVLAGPGLPEAQVSDLPVSGLDLPPTLLALAGLRVPDGWAGRDLLAALAGEDRGPRGLRRMVRRGKREVRRPRLPRRADPGAQADFLEGPCSGGGALRPRRRPGGGAQPRRRSGGAGGAARPSLPPRGLDAAQWRPRPLLARRSALT